MRVRPIDVVDVFVYVTILNLANQFVPAVITESFAMSVATAVLLKLVLEVVLILKTRVKRRFVAAQSVPAKVVAALGFWALMVGSKFVVLELEALLLGDAVSLGGFFSVTGLIIVLLLSRLGMRRALRRAATDEDSKSVPSKTPAGAGH